LVRAARQARHADCFSDHMVLDNEFFSATILQLIEYYGIVDLALMLDVHVEDLYQWAEGRARPPAEVFLRVIDLRNGCSVNA
jgi:hypothetical protein